MTITVLTEKKIQKTIPKNFFDGYNVELLDINRGDLKSFKNEDLIVLLTQKILSRENNAYKKLIDNIKNKKINMIEIAFKKSKLENKKSYSDSIIYGFEDMTLNLILKIIKNHSKN
ncbi:MAG: hypothetical protein CMP36_03670 [Rickettsiales bacterium]|nr:hypothetical protein [Rickettsiales bacterium]OUV78966.1 MAG: hypothetical protein CBC91_04440 [Rickettsiales bacterium TMED131]